MVDPSQLGKLLIILGVFVTAVGILIAAGPNIPWFPRLGRLPGDFTIRSGGTTIYLPLATSLVLSIILTIVLALWRR